MKKQYLQPTFNAYTVVINDIITTSAGLSVAGAEDGGHDKISMQDFFG